MIKNDIAAAPGICLTVFVQGCPIHCENCHNPDSWSFTGGREFTNDTLKEIIDGLTANGVQRTLCIMGGEPLCSENLFLTSLIISTVKERIPSIKIWVWTGYDYDDLKKSDNSKLQYILNNINGIVDGPYVDAERDVTLSMRGSRNQRVIELA